MITVDAVLKGHGIGSSGASTAGKQKIADALVTMNQTATKSNTYDELAQKIKDISKDATATQAQVLAGQSVYIGGAKQNGTMPDATQNITPSTVNIAINPGYHNGTGVVAGDPDLVPANIKAGANIFGVAGSGTVVDTADAALDPAFLVVGYSGYDDGVKKNGTLVDATTSITPGASNQAIPHGYHNGTGIVMGDPDLTAGNIKTGVSIFGVTGTLNPGVSRAKLTYNPADVTGFGSGTTTIFTFNITGLTFTPAAAFLTGTSLVYTLGGGGGSTPYGLAATTDTTNYFSNAALVPANGYSLTLSMSMTSVVFGGCTLTVTCTSSTSNNSFNSNSIKINLFG